MARRTAAPPRCPVCALLDHAGAVLEATTGTERRRVPPLDSIEQVYESLWLVHLESETLEAALAKQGISAAQTDEILNDAERAASSMLRALIQVCASASG
jgi:hypothetical protein